MIQLETQKGNQTKERIIKIAARLFLEKGYNATGINEIIAGAEIPKGSFYFHFGSKKELAVKVADYYSNRLGQWLRQSALGKNWVEFISTLAVDMKTAAQRGRHYGCPIGVLGVEIAFVQPELAEVYAQAFEGLIAIFAEVLESSGVDHDQVANLSRKAFCRYQGYVQCYRITKNIAVFDEMVQDLSEITKQPS